MKTLKFLLYSSVFIAFSACKTTFSSEQKATSKAPYHQLMLHGKLYAAFYQQHAAEYEALCIQSFNIAKLRLDEVLNEKSDKPLAIVSDIDETFLDNSYFSVSQAKDQKIYDQKSWSDWTAQGTFINMRPIKVLQFFISPTDTKTNGKARLKT